MVAALVAALIGIVAFASPANAASTTPPSDPSVGPSTGGTVQGYPGTNPHILAKIAAAKASGSLVSVSTTPYRPTTAKGAAAASKIQPLADGFPSDCGLVILVFHEGLVVEGDGYTDCVSAFEEGSQDTYMAHYNPDWGTWDQVAEYNSGVIYGATFVEANAVYNCNNTNSSGYEAVSTGQIIQNGESYSASAYDDSSPFLVPCGT